MAERLSGDHETRSAFINVHSDFAIGCALPSLMSTLEKVGIQLFVSGGRQAIWCRKAEFSKRQVKTVGCEDRGETGALATARKRPAYNPTLIDSAGDHPW
jgi:hypothetical protein